MHEPVKVDLEGCLSEQGGSAAAKAHLASCPECREELVQMREQSSWIQELRVPEAEELEPSPGFYARVMEQIEAQRAKISFWSGFLEPMFAKRLVFASLMLFVLLGTVAAVLQPDRTEEEVAQDHPEVIMMERAQPAVAVEDSEQQRNAMLVNLSTYSEPVGAIQ